MSGKFKIIVSDLHLSAGHAAEGNPLEDFGSDQEFASLLDGLAAESERDGAEVELIVNGDAFEMLQVPNVTQFQPDEVYPPPTYHSSSEADSVLKMAIIIAAHQLFFDALKRFVQPGPPRRHVTFVKGNHDINLHWDGVQAAIRQAVGATGPRLRLATFEERRVSREGIYVEHGNQYAEIVDRINDMEEPHDHENPDQLAIPLGSWFVMDVFNIVERQRYWIDGVKPITSLVWYALAYDFRFAVRALVILARALPSIIGEHALDAEGAEDSIFPQIADPNQVEALAAQYETDLAFRADFNTQVAAILAPPPDLPGIDAVPIAADANPVAMGDQVRQRVASSLFEIAGKKAVEEGAQVVSFGHTHDASLESLPNGATYINSGTWTWRADFSGAGKETWRDLFAHPERFTNDRLLSYVRIDYDDQDQAQGSLHAWGPSGWPSSGSGPLGGLMVCLRGLWQRLTGG
jgi:UDP-2,3-diacylglucosamine pyrophosphatase LpxH